MRPIQAPPPRRGAPPLDTESLARRLAPDGWLDHRTRAPFVSLATATPVVSEREVEDFFARRALEARPGQRARDLMAADVRAIAHAASFLFSAGADRTARRMIPEAVALAVTDDLPQLDHVGIEVFGRLEWYIEALGAWSRTAPVHLTGYRTFPSVQVRRILSYDRALSGVRIARLCLESEERAARLELFEVAQDWLQTANRQLFLVGDGRAYDVERRLQERGEPLARPLLPVGHLALTVRRARTVKSVHRILAEREREEGKRILYDELPSYNPGDGSLNTKFLPSEVPRSDRSVRGPMIELISYGYRPSGSGDTGGKTHGVA